MRAATGGFSRRPAELNGVGRLCAGVTRIGSIRLCCGIAPLCVAIVALGMLCPNIDRAESTVAQQTPQKHNLVRPGTQNAAPHLGTTKSSLGATKSWPGVAGHAIHPPADHPIPRGTTASATLNSVPRTPGVRPAPTAAAQPRSRGSESTGHFTSYYSGAHRVAGISGNDVRRRVPVATAVGGPAQYDAKKSAVIGGTAMEHER